MQTPSRGWEAAPGWTSKAPTGSAPEHPERPGPGRRTTSISRVPAAAPSAAGAQPGAVGAGSGGDSGSGNGRGRRAPRPSRAAPSRRGRGRYITCAAPPLREDVACSLAPGESPRLPRELGERNWRRSTPGGSALQHEPISSRSRRPGRAAAAAAANQWPRERAEPRSSQHPALNRGPHHEFPAC